MRDDVLLDLLDHLLSFFGARKTAKDVVSLVHAAFRSLLLVSDDLLQVNCIILLHLVLSTLLIGPL